MTYQKYDTGKAVKMHSWKGNRKLLAKIEENHDNILCLPKAISSY